MNESFHREYDAPFGAEALVNQPRWGRTRDFIALLGNDSAEKTDYIIGLIFFGILTLCIFLAWGVMIFAFMRCGRRRVGWWSGQPFHKPPPKCSKNTSNGASESFHDEPKQTEQGKHQDPHAGRGDKDEAFFDWHQSIRCVFIVAALIFIIFAILLVTRGAANLQNSIITVNYSAATASTMVGETERILKWGLGDLKDYAVAVRNTLVDELDSTHFCPAQPLELNNDQVSQVGDMTSNAVTLLSDLDGILVKSGGDLLEVTEQLQKGSESVENYTSELDVTDWKLILIMIPYMVVPCFLLMGTIMAMFDASFAYFPFTLNRVLLPIFIIMVVIACVVQGVILIVAGINSDFCLAHGDPDPSVIALVEDVGGFAPDSRVHQGVNWYVNQCQGDQANNPLAQLDVYLSEMTSAQESLDLLETTMQDQNAVAELTLFCGRDFSPLVSTMDTMKEVLTMLLHNIRDLKDLFSCENVVNLYQMSVWDGLCQYSVRGWIWIYWCTLIMAFSGMIMITCRAAYKLTIDPYESSNDDESQPPGSPAFAPGLQSPRVAEDYRSDKFEDEPNDPGYKDNPSILRIGNDADANQGFDQNGIQFAPGVIGDSLRNPNGGAAPTSESPNDHQDKSDMFNMPGDKDGKELSASNRSNESGTKGQNNWSTKIYSPHDDDQDHSFGYDEEQRVREAQGQDDGSDDYSVSSSEYSSSEEASDSWNEDSSDGRRQLT